MHAEVRLVRTVEFSETDLAGIVHFTHYLKWMEAAEAAFFAARGASLVTDAVETLQGWPRVEVAAAYHAPLRFREQVEIHLELKEARASALRWQATFRVLDPASGSPRPEPVATASMTTLHATLDRRTGTLRATLIPDALRNCLTAGIPLPSQAT